MHFKFILCLVVLSAFHIEAMKSINWWEITKVRYIEIDTDVCFETAKADETQEKTQDETQEKAQDEIQEKAQDETESKVETDIREKSKSGWIITKEKLPDYCKEHNCMLSDLFVMPTGRLDTFVVQVEMYELTENLKKKAKEVLKETPENMETSIPELQRLIREKEDLKVPVDNVAWLKRFLRPAKYDPDKAFIKIIDYYSFKIKNNKHIELYKGLKPSREKNLFDQDIMIVLPKRDQEGRRILVVEIGEKWDYSKCSLDEIYKGAVLFLEAAMLEPETQISGAVVIFDMKGLSNGQILHFSMNLPFVQRVADLLQIYQHGYRNSARNQAKLHKYISPDRLPPEYGGTCEIPRIMGPDWYNALSILDKE